MDDLNLNALERTELKFDHSGVSKFWVILNNLSHHKLSIQHALESYLLRTPEDTFSAFDFCAYCMKTPGIFATTEEDFEKLVNDDETVDFETGGGGLSSYKSVILQPKEFRKALF